MRFVRKHLACTVNDLPACSYSRRREERKVKAVFYVYVDEDEKHRQDKREKVSFDQSERLKVEGDRSFLRSQLRGV